ncbi:MAG: hypothetical protein D3913_13810 [Candidatus Electrothrix sp. LOE1_4_5]|nr:hypothetical protein [Candidatus Electrothrix gigas]
MASKNRSSQYKNTIIFLAIFSLSACANMSEKQKISGQATGTGAAIGAASGAAVLEDNRLLGALLGGAVGGITGYVVGEQQVNHIDQKKQENIETENVTNSLQQETARISSYNYGLKQQIDQFERDRIRNIDRRGEARMHLKTAQDERKKLLSIAARERQKIHKMSNSTQRRLDQNQLQKLQEEINELNRSIRRLHSIGYGRVG